MVLELLCSAKFLSKNKFVVLSLLNVIRVYYFVLVVFFKYLCFFLFVAGSKGSGAEQDQFISLPNNYALLPACHMFVPVSFESLGPVNANFTCCRHSVSE